MISDFQFKQLQLTCIKRLHQGRMKMYITVLSDQ